MSKIEGEALTGDPMRIIRRLCRHWSHKFTTQLEEASGSIQLNDVLVVLRAAPDRVFVSLENPQGEVPERLKGVVAEHMQRMAGAEPPLEVRWAGNG
ncbi:MAG: DUF2218 domain-containing protein [Steroidobacteraceae bacterium]